MNECCADLSRTTMRPPSGMVMCLLSLSIFFCVAQCAYALTREALVFVDEIFQADGYVAGKLESSLQGNYQSFPAINTPSDGVQRLNQMSTATGNVLLQPSRETVYSADFSYLEMTLDTDDNIISYIDQNFDYKYDFRRPYRPLSPQELNTLRAGDCKDSAVFFGHFASLHGLQGSQITYRYSSSNSTAGHVVNLYYSEKDKDDNVLWMHSNGQKYGPIHNENEFYKYAVEALGPVADEAVDFLSFPLNNKGELRLK